MIEYAKGEAAVLQGIVRFFRGLKLGQINKMLN
jgi:hypothetical protein